MEVTQHVAYRGTYDPILAPRLVKLPTFSKNSKMEFEDSYLTLCLHNRIADVLGREDDGHERRTEGKYNSAYGMNVMLDVGCNA